METPPPPTPPTAPQPPRPRRSLRRRLLHGLVFVVLALLFMELTVRLFWEPPPAFVGERLVNSGVFVPDDELGWRGAPNQEFLHELYGGHQSTIRTNSRGFRCGEHAPKKPAGKQRVVILGDSFAYGYGVDNHQTFASHLDQRLAGVEVINLGLTGYNLVQAHRLLQREGLGYEPDLVVVAFCQNDVTDRRMPTAAEQRRTRKQLAPRPGLKAFLLRHSYLVNFLRWQTNTIRPLRRFLQWTGLKEGDEGYDRLDPNLRPALRTWPAELRRQWDDTMAELLALNATCNRAGARLLVAAVPTKQSLSSAALAHSLAYSALATADFDLDKPYLALANFCREHGILFRNAKPALEGADAYLQHDMHFSPKGHRVFAEALEDPIRTALGGR